MKLVLAIACALCLTLTGTLFAFSQATPGESYAAYADATRNATSCELSSCGCLGLRCSCFDCGK
ncbi:hypothetical protein [Solidesulfovibrio sp.]|jgi:hypothetical protein|uniref:hypothetical protein n=1 Tax=Solidesulfovibrio sp. TaxID=2910990 RepID=UPI000ECA8154|nr:hypothetical protein [Solidesulfovibrio sp.]MEA5089336.1 hypothetical protein [Solidesulfovibrio sp.]HCR14464.1 hypothetical protein [Desulfovibrio sp.]HML60148.1 hypothetical protein [Solidesulfovibrio sp.]